MAGKYKQKMLTPHQKLNVNLFINGSFPCRFYII